MLRQQWDQIKDIFKSDSNDNSVISWRKISIAFILILILGLLGEFIYRILQQTPIMAWLSVRHSDTEALLNTLFQVQTTVSILSISLLAIIFGQSQVRRYGMKPIYYFAIRNKWWLNLYDKLIVVMSLIIVTYFLNALGMVTGVVITFVVSMFLIIRMLILCLKFIVLDDILDAEIKEYISSTVDEEIKAENYKIKEKFDNSVSTPNEKNPFQVKHQTNKENNHAI